MRGLHFDQMRVFVMAGGAFSPATRRRIGNGLAGLRGNPDVEFRFAKSTRIGEPSAARPDLGPCLLFLGALNGNGYGQFRFNARNGYAHRYAWERVHGPIPGDLTIDHLCRVRRCVEVTHMELVPGVENFYRAMRAKTHCHAGHEYTTPFQPGTRRRCVECTRGYWRKDALKNNRRVNGLPIRSIKYDQTLVRTLLLEVRAGSVTISQAAREIGCNPGYLGRRAWEETRAAVIARDGHCLRCGSGEPFEAHHRIPRGRGGTSRPLISFGLANLVTLCRPCHSAVESDRDAAREQGWLLYRSQDPATVPVYVAGRGLCLLDDGGNAHPLAGAA